MLLKIITNIKIMFYHHLDIYFSKLDFTEKSINSLSIFYVYIMFP